MQNVIDQLHPNTTIKLGGAGNKLISLVLNHVDIYLQTRSGIRFWDLCAGDCLLRAMGGVITDMFGEPL